MDLETDAKIQRYVGSVGYRKHSLRIADRAFPPRTIQTQFHDRTLLCIARKWPSFGVRYVYMAYLRPILSDRLRTIINYDRILVMSDGQIAVGSFPLLPDLSTPTLTRLNYLHRNSTPQSTSSTSPTGSSVECARGAISRSQT